MVATPEYFSKLGSLKKRSEFLHVRDGRYKAQGGVVVQMRKNPQETDAIRVGFTATKKIGNAVVRNKAKRRLRQCARALLPRCGTAGHDYVLIARNSTVGRDFALLLDDVEKALLSLSQASRNNI